MGLGLNDITREALSGNEFENKVGAFKEMLSHIKYSPSHDRKLPDNRVVLPVRLGDDHVEVLFYIPGDNATDVATKFLFDHGFNVDASGVAAISKQLEIREIRDLHQRAAFSVNECFLTDNYDPQMCGEGDDIMNHRTYVGNINAGCKNAEGLDFPTFVINLW
jgi:hypothetical protein